MNNRRGHKKRAIIRGYVMQVWRTRCSWEPRGLVGMAVMCIVLVAVTSMLMGVVGYFIRKMMGAE